MAACLQIAPYDIENSITQMRMCLYRSCRAWDNMFENTSIQI